MSARVKNGETEELVKLLYQQILGRVPNNKELLKWQASASDPSQIYDMINFLVESDEYTTRNRVRAKYPAGHYFSPIVDPETVRDYVDSHKSDGPGEIAGINFNLDAMLEYWKTNIEILASTPFTDKPDSTNRYYYKCGPYPDGDAIMLRAIIGAQRPRKIIEIGSGLSTACMLDAADHFSLTDLRITCIEPYTERLRSLLKPGDEDRLEIIEENAQGSPLSLFSQLEKNDILFIDSTHVLKTGSDVHYELFSILPVLRQGVLVHFHDCRFPFEYPEKFIFERNFSWNEVYAIRAFLMYNTKFNVFFYNSLFVKFYINLVKETCPEFLRNPGSSLWLNVQ